MSEPNEYPKIVEDGFDFIQFKDIPAHMCGEHYARVRERGDIVLPVASNGIASLPLHKDRAAHSRFEIPLECNENSTCSKINSDHEVTGLLKKTKLIIWECTNDT